MAQSAHEQTNPKGGPGSGGAHTPHGYASLLGLRRYDVAGLQERVLRGFRYQTVRRLQDEIDLTLAELGELVQIHPRTLARRRVEGRLQPDESDRVLRAARVLGKAAELFEGDMDAARRWLGAKNRALGGQTPLEYARTGIGAREVERLIGRLEHGVAT